MDADDGLRIGSDGRPRCWWAVSHPLYEPYHDAEWGRPVKDDRRLFEKLSLEGFMAGLSWLTILRKRDHFREVFQAFDPAAISRFGPAYRSCSFWPPAKVTTSSCSASAKTTGPP